MMRVAAVDGCCCWRSGPGSAPAADDPLARARLLYNQRQFEAAVQAAEQARLTPARADAADLIAARAYLERFRESAASDDLTNARDRLRRLDPQRVRPARARRVHRRPRRNAVLRRGVRRRGRRCSTRCCDSRDALAGEARERVLDWWASALDRDAKPRPEIERQGVYQRIRDADATTSWRRIPAAAPRPTGSRRRRGRRAICRRRGTRRRPAGCARRCASDSGVALRADLDRLVLRAIVPERAKATAQPPETLRARVGAASRRAGAEPDCN